MTEGDWVKLLPGGGTRHLQAINKGCHWIRDSDWPARICSVNEDEATLESWSGSLFRCQLRILEKTVYEPTSISSVRCPYVREDGFKVLYGVRRKHGLELDPIHPKFTIPRVLSTVFGVSATMQGIIMGGSARSVLLLVGAGLMGASEIFRLVCRRLSVALHGDRLLPHDLRKKLKTFEKALKARKDVDDLVRRGMTAEQYTEEVAGWQKQSDAIQKQLGKAVRAVFLDCERVMKLNSIKSLEKNLVALDDGKGRETRDYASYIAAAAAKSELEKE